MTLRKNQSKQRESGQLPFSPQAFPVSQRVLPGSEEARMMTVGFGRKLLECSESLSQHGPCLRTLAVSLVLSKEWYSRVCLLRWKARGTKCNRTLFQLVPSAHGTEEIESSLWLTPSASDGEGGNMVMGLGKGRYKLRDQVLPVNQSYQPASMFPTPRANKTGGVSSPEFCPALEQVIKLLPTPKLPSGGGQMARNTPGGGIRKLEDAVSQLEGRDTGALNPEWVGWLMGFPEGWLD